MMFAQTLRRLMKERGVTQQKLARAVGIARATLGYYVCGERDPTISTVARIADYLDVSIDYLVGTVAKKEPRYPTWREFFAGLYPGLPPFFWIDYQIQENIAKNLGIEPIKEDKP
jgi:transcriptional regulator with XRE-family HTH domain